MPEAALTNIASASGSYNSIPSSMETAPRDTLMVDGLSIRLDTDKEVWITGPLIYTVTVSNNASLPYVSPAVSVTLDPSLAVLEEGTVVVDGALTSDYTYESSTGALHVRIPTLKAGTASTVTFQAKKAPV